MPDRAFSQMRGGIPQAVLDQITQANVQTRVEVLAPTTPMPGATIKCESLVFDPGAVLEIRDLGASPIAIVTKELVLQDASHLSLIQRDPSIAPINGRDGAPGGAGTPSWNPHDCGGSGRNGGPGGFGIQGSPAPPARPLPTLYIFVKTITSLTTIPDWVPMLAVNYRGLEGGRGGRGGDGGHGGSGEKGSEGHSEIYQCHDGPGRGGNGGPGGMGGHGGNGGHGGSGGDVWLVGTATFIDALKAFRIDNAGGQPGRGGAAGHGGLGGDFGRGGCPRGWCTNVEDGWYGPDGSAGFPGFPAPGPVKTGSVNFVEMTPTEFDQLFSGIRS
jgi:hypothetical protein